MAERTAQVYRELIDHDPFHMLSTRHAEVRL
jgi:hypothetical protein